MNELTLQEMIELTRVLKDTVSWRGPAQGVYKDYHDCTTKINGRSVKIAVRKNTRTSYSITITSDLPVHGDTIIGQYNGEQVKEAFENARQGYEKTQERLEISQSRNEILIGLRKIIEEKKE